MGDERKKTVDPDGVKGSVLLHADVMVKEHHTTTTEAKPHPPAGSQKLEGAEHDIVVRECTASAPALFKRLVKHVLNVVCLLVLLSQIMSTLSNGRDWSPKFLHSHKLYDVEPKKVNCFIDHPINFFPPSETMEEEPCAGKYVSCPSWGRCHNGKLQDCDNPGGSFGPNGVVRFIPNASGDECIPNKEVLEEVVDSVVQVIIGMTVDQHCKLQHLG